MCTRCPEPISRLRWSEENRRDVVDLVGGLSAGTLLGRSTATAPTLPSIQHQSEEQDEQEESDQATLWNKEQERNNRLMTELRTDLVSDNTFGQWSPTVILKIYLSGA